MDDSYIPDTIDAALIPDDPTAGWNPLSNTIYNALTGTLSPGQLSDIQNQTAADIARAGGNSAARQAATQEVGSFVNDFFPARSPAQTLWDVATGNPLGNKKQDSSWAVVIVIVIAVLLVVALLKTVFK